MGKQLTKLGKSALEWAPEKVVGDWLDLIWNRSEVEPRSNSCTAQPAQPILTGILRLAMMILPTVVFNGDAQWCWMIQNSRTVRESVFSVQLGLLGRQSSFICHSASAPASAADAHTHTKHTFHCYGAPLNVPLMHGGGKMCLSQTEVVQLSPEAAAEVCVVQSCN